MSQPMPEAVATPLEPPYSRYHLLRTGSPFYVDPHSGRLIVTRYADVSAALKHPQLSSRAVLQPVLKLPPLLRPVLRPVVDTLSRLLIFTDPPDHTRLRALAIRAFTPRAVETLRVRVREIAEGLLDEMDPARGPVDLIAEFANPLPVAVIAELLGADIRNRRQFKRWSDDWALLISDSSQAPAKVALRGAVSGFHLHRYLKGLIRRRKKRPGNTLLDTLIAAEEGGDALTQAELIANAILFLVGGHITTTNLIGNGMLALLRYPDQLELLRAEPDLMPGAVEELLRYDSPLQYAGRVASEACELNGQPVAAGQTVVLGIGAANRDPAQFPEPDRLDLRRRDNRHLAFGAGIHFCLGAALARLEGQVALEALLHRFPEIHLAPEPLVWREAGVIRGLKRLPLQVL